MTTTEETLVSIRHEMRTLLEKTMEGVLSKFRGVLENAEQQRVKGLADMVEERAEVAEKAEAWAKQSHEKMKGVVVNARREREGALEEVARTKQETRQQAVEATVALDALGAIMREALLVGGWDSASHITAQRLEAPSSHSLVSQYSQRKHSMFRPSRLT
jgi:uncharacterized protein YgbK (DUF1537 family)